MKLAPKLTILFLLLSIVPTAIVGYFAYENGRRTIVQETIDHLVSINLFKNNELKRWIEENKSSIEELAQRLLVRQYAAVLTKHDTPDPAYHKAKGSIIEDHLKRRLKYGGFFELFVMCPRHGLISASTNEEQESKYKDTYPYFIEGKSRTYIQGIYYSRVLEQPAMTISTPIKDKQGNLMGVLAGRLDLPELSKIISLQTGTSPTEDTYLVNTFNFFVTEPRFGQGYALKKAVRTKGVEAGLTGQDGIGFYKDYRGVPVIGAYKWLPDFNMCIITEIGQAEAFAPVVRLAWVIAGIASAISIAAGLLGLFFARTITRPVRKLAAGAEEIGAGNLEHRVGRASKDEIGGLSRAFDRMTESLKATMVSRDELAKSEERFRLAAESSTDLIYEWDIKERVDWFGKIDELLGYGPSEFPRTLGAWANSVHPDDRDRVMSAVNNHLEKNEPYDIEYRVRKKDGTYNYWWARGTAVRDEKGNPYRWVGAVTDITERKQAEEEIRKLNAELEQRVRDRTTQLEATNKELEAFSYSVSHDLRAPLRGIDGFSRVLLEDYVEKLDDEGKRYLNIIRSNTKKMGQLIDDLLVFSHLGRQEINLSEINMDKLAKAVFDELRGPVPERALRLNVKTMPSAQADRSMIHQVFVNLLSNAIKFTRPKQTALIEVEGRSEGNENIYCIRDNGVGFDMQYVNKLFGVFQRLHSTEEFEGTGVGLAIVQRIIHRHGGRVWAEGKVGEGATFYFSLPRNDYSDHKR